MRILRAGNYRRMPWKNGGGETAEIALFPEDAGLDDFGWRISMAQVEAGGPFSSFPGVDRTLSILEGSGMMLDIEDRRPVTLTEASAPYSFPADDTTHAELIDGPVTDLNVMTRRGRYGHTVTRYEIAGTGDFVPGGSPSVLFCHAKDLRIRGEGFEAELGMFDAAVFGEDIGNGLQVEGSGRLFLIEIERMA